MKKTPSTTEIRPAIPAEKQRRLVHEFRQLQTIWSKKTLEKGIRTEKDLKELIRH
jgi:hypothetical protein